MPSSPAPEKTFLERESGISYRSLDVQLDPTQPSQKTYYPDPQHQLSQEQLLRAGTPPPSHLLIPIGSTQFSSSQSHALWNTSIAQEYFSRTFAPRWWLMAIPALFFCIQNNLMWALKYPSKYKSMAQFFCFQIRGGKMSACSCLPGNLSTQGEAYVQASLLLRAEVECLDPHHRSLCMFNARKATLICSMALALLPGGWSSDYSTQLP